MRLAEVHQRACGIAEIRAGAAIIPLRERLYRDTLRTLLSHDLPDDARQLIEAALEAER